MSELTQNELVSTITDGLGYPGSDEFDKTINTLREIPSPRLAEIFTELLDDPDAQLALGIAGAIGILECSKAVNLLIGLVDEPGKWFGYAERASIQHSAVGSLGILRDDSAIDILIDLINNTRDIDLLMEAIRSLGMIGSPKCVRPLISAMAANPPIALSAAGALAEIGGEEAFMGLMGCLSSNEEFIKSASIWALGKMGDIRAVGPLVKLTGDCDSFMRRDIVWAIGQIGGLRARLMLGALCQNDADFGVRCESAKAIFNGAVLGSNRERKNNSQVET